VISYSHIHSAVDDHSRPAYSEVVTDERQESHRRPPPSGMTTTTTAATPPSEATPDHPRRTRRSLHLEVELALDA
jgi:hypothetical protein